MGDDELAVKYLVDHDWIASGVPLTYRDSVLKNQVYQKLVYNEQGTATSILAKLVPLGKDDNARDQVIVDIKSITKDYENQVDRFYYSGLPIFNRTVYSIIEREQSLTTAIMLVLVGLIFYLIYRRLLLVLIPLSLLGIVITWVMGLIHLTGQKFNWFLALVPAVVLIVSICDAVHIMNSYLHSKETDKKKRILHVIKSVGIPCFLTSVTTIIGFLTLTSSRITPLKNFGFDVSFGVLIAFLMSVTILPIILYSIKSTHTVKSSQRYHQFIQRLLNWIHNINMKRGTLVLVVSLLFVAFCAIGITKIVHDQRFITIYKWGSDNLVATKKFSEKYDVGGASESYVYLQAKAPPRFL